MEKDVLFFHDLIGDCTVQKDSKRYSISPKFGSGFMESYMVMPGAEVIYSDVFIHNTIQKNIQSKDAFVEVTYCLNGRVEMEFMNQPAVSMEKQYISIFNGKSQLKCCDIKGEPFVGVSVVAYLPQIITSLNIMLGTLAFTEDLDLKKVFNKNGCVVTPASQTIKHIFEELILLPEQYRNYLMRIKVMELLLYLIGKMEYKTNLSLFEKEDKV